MLVSGVFRSWLTLVDQLTALRAHLILEAPPACRPPSEPRSSAIAANTPSGISVSLKLRSPRILCSAATIRSKPSMRLIRK